MSKRFIYPQQYGERKKAKLDVTVSDHNFPLSQNPSPSKDVDQANTWGDDNDDEILLLASQACEEAYNDHNNSTLPDYSMCMQPSTTSTQMSKATPSTSKSGFSFKKPTFSPMSAVSTKMRDSFKTISSPLPGMSKDFKTDGVNVSDDIIINDNIFKGQDSNHMYRQLLQLQEENAKLKSENGKLLEKCFTKEGEASILRTQLKTCQTAVDSARMEKIKAQERAQMEWSEKLTAVNKQVHDLRNQLDFKNMEMISVKEKCKMLESNKVKLTQVTVAGNDILMSQRHNKNVYVKQEPSLSLAKKVKTASSGVQTEDKSHFLKLNLRLREGSSKLSQVLPFTLEATTHQYSILDYNEKLRQPTEIRDQCRISSTFHRLPATPSVCKEITKSVKNLNHIYEDLSHIAANKNSSIEFYLNIFRVARNILRDIQQELEAVSRRMTPAFQKEMDQRYIDATSKFIVVQEKDLLSGRSLYDEEQGILARRITCILYHLLEDNKNKEIYKKLLEPDGKCGSNVRRYCFIDDISNMCALLDNTTCALLYSGLLTSITLLLQAISSYREKNKEILLICKSVIMSRPMPFVTGQLLKLLEKLSSYEDLLKDICCESSNGNLKVDYDQGVLMYKKDSCTIQILLKQTDVALKCIEQHGAVQEALDITRSLLRLYCNLNSQSDGRFEKNKCDCHTVFIQVIIFALRICAEHLHIKKSTDLVDTQEALSACRGGVQLLQRCGALPALDGPLQALCRALARRADSADTDTDTDGDHAGQRDNDLTNMLSEITSTFQTYPEELPASYHARAWMKSFQSFSITD